MAAPGVPYTFYVQTANRQVLVSWSLSSGATSYIVQRSEDNITYATIATITGSPLATQYIDSAVTTGTQYFYRVSAENGESSGYTVPQSAVPTPTGELTLGQIRLQAQQRADRVNSTFLTLPEWNSNINKAMFELYDLLVTTFEDYYVAPPIQFTTTGSQYLYPLPDGLMTFQNAITLQPLVARPFYKLMGVDLAVQNANNGYVTVNKFNFADRNKFVYPNTASTIYGVFNMQYRVLGNNIEFIPTPSANQPVRLWYIPRLNELLSDTDTTDISVSGWIEYVIVRAAKYALDKEESDSSKLAEEILFLKKRIEETAANRDAGMPDTISDVRQGSNGWDGGWGGRKGGF